MNPVKLLIALVVFGAILAIPIVYAGPQLYGDMRATGWELAPDLQVTSTGCKRWFAVIATCSVDIASPREPARIQPQLHYLVLLSWAGQRVTLLRAKNDPTHVTVTLGIEHMTDRQMTLAAYAGAALVLLMVILYGRMRTVALARNPYAEHRTPDMQRVARRQG